MKMTRIQSLLVVVLVACLSGLLGCTWFGLFFPPYIENPSFEEDGSWVNPFPGECTKLYKPVEDDRAVGITDGYYALYIRADTWHSLTPRYVYQDFVTLTGVHAILFDWTACDEHIAGGGEARIYFKGQLIWRHDIWEGAGEYDYQQHLNEMVDVSVLTGMGRLTLEVRTRDDWAEVIFDNFRCVEEDG